MAELGANKAKARVQASMLMAAVVALTAIGAAGEPAAATSGLRPAVNLRSSPVSEEPVWNREPWETGRAYYAAWARLHFCVLPEAEERTVDDLMTALMDFYHPRGDNRTMWAIANDGTALVSPELNRDMAAGITWPHARENMQSTKLRCVASSGPSCCCKARGTWEIYARFGEEGDARRLIDTVESLTDWESHVCIGPDSGGVTAETVDTKRHTILREPLLALTVDADGLAHLGPAQHGMHHRSSHRYRPLYISIGFFGVFAVVIALTCVVATTRAMWHRFVYEPLRKYYQAVQFIDIDTGVAKQAARLRRLYERHQHCRDPLNETDDDVLWSEDGDSDERGDEELMLLENPVVAMASPAPVARTRAAAAASNARGSPGWY